MNVEVRSGDISEQKDLDAIVCPAGTEPRRAAGLAGLLLQRGGQELEQELEGKGPVDLGQVVETRGGKLPARYVLHAAVTGFRPEDLAVPKRPQSLSSAPILQAATAASLALAEKLGCRTVGFPCLGTGLAMVPADECARAMLDGIAEYSRAHPESALERVVFVMFLPSDAEAFQQALDEEKNRRRAS